MTKAVWNRILTERETIAIKAMEVFAPANMKNKTNWLAVTIAITDYDSHPSNYKQILNELSSPEDRKKRLVEAHKTLLFLLDAKTRIKELSSKIEEGFQRQDARLTFLEESATKQSRINDEQIALLKSRESRDLDAAAKEKRQKRWALAGKVLSGIVGGLLALCTVLGVPTKYTQPLIDKIIDPVLEKIGLYRPEKIQKPKILHEPLPEPKPQDNERHENSTLTAPPSEPDNSNHTEQNCTIDRPQQPPQNPPQNNDKDHKAKKVIKRDKPSPRSHKGKSSLHRPASAKKIHSRIHHL